MPCIPMYVHVGQQPASFMHCDEGAFVREVEDRSGFGRWRAKFRLFPSWDSAQCTAADGMAMSRRCVPEVQTGDVIEGKLKGAREGIEVQKDRDGVRRCLPSGSVLQRNNEMRRRIMGSSEAGEA